MEGNGPNSTSRGESQLVPVRRQHTSLRPAGDLDLAEGGLAVQLSQLLGQARQPFAGKPHLISMLGEIVNHSAIGLPGLTQAQHLQAEADMQLGLGAHGPTLGIVGQDAPVDRHRLLEVALDLFRVDAGLEKALRGLLAEGR